MKTSTLILLAVAAYVVLRPRLAAAAPAAPGDPGYLILPSGAPPLQNRGERQPRRGGHVR